MKEIVDFYGSENLPKRDLKRVENLSEDKRIDVNWEGDRGSVVCEQVCELLNLDPWTLLKT